MEERLIQYPAQEQQKQCQNTVCTSTYSVHISMTEYVLACTEYMHHINASANLGIKGMETPLWQIEGITSGTHSTLNS